MSLFRTIQLQDITSKNRLRFKLLLLKKGDLPAETKLAFARVCKQINREALPTNYGLNTFKNYRMESTEICLTALRKRRRDLIRNICFAYSDKNRTAAMKTFGGCLGLQRLETEVSEDTAFGSNWRKTRICDLCLSSDLDELLKIRGCREVVVRYEERIARKGAPRVTAEKIKKLVELARKELCQPRR